MVLIGHCCHLQNNKDGTPLGNKQNETQKLHSALKKLTMIVGDPSISTLALTFHGQSPPLQ
jgi:hypothetical protein